MQDEQWVFFESLGKNEPIFKKLLGSGFWVSNSNHQYLRLLVQLYFSMGTMECSFYFILMIAIMRGNPIKVLFSRCMYTFTFVIVILNNPIQGLIILLPTYLLRGSEHQPTVSTKPFRVSSTNRSMDSMPGTPATFASYCDPASPASSSHHPHSRSNSLVAKMDMEIGLGAGGGGGCNDSDDGGGPSGTKSLLMSKT